MKQKEKENSFANTTLFSMFFFILNHNTETNKSLLMMVKVVDTTFLDTYTHHVFVCVCINLTILSLAIFVFLANKKKIRNNLSMNKNILPLNQWLTIHNFFIDYQNDRIRSFLGEKNETFHSFQMILFLEKKEILNWIFVVKKKRRKSRNETWMRKKNILGLNNNKKKQ